MKKIKPEKLEFVPSLHEQREGYMSKELRKDDWIEFGYFDYLTENVKVMERYEVENIKRTEDEKFSYIEIQGKKINLKEYNKKITKLINEVMKKRGDKLKTSFVKCLYEVY